MATIKQKKRLNKSLTKRTKTVEKEKLDSAFRNIFVKSGYLKVNK